ncbi:RNA 2'-phosphotransferase [Thermodesulfobacteriota bacterium]
MAYRKSPQILSKFLSYVLGRKPDEFGLVLDPDGFVKIKDVLKAVCEEDGWKYVRRSYIDEILFTLPDPPFEIKDNLIRAKDRGKLPPHTLANNPPKLLYVCVRRKAYPFVLDKGIFPTGYRRVILSSSRGQAERMGKRSDPEPVLLTVHTHKSIQKGIVFYQAGDTLYFADSIHPGCFTGPPLPKYQKEAQKPVVRKESATYTPAGSFILDLKDKKEPKDRAKQNKKRGKQKRVRPPWRS